MHVSPLILIHGHVFTSSFNCTAQQLNSILTKRLLVLFFRDLVAYVKHVIFFFFFFFFADSNNNTHCNLVIMRSVGSKVADRDIGDYAL